MTKTQQPTFQDVERARQRLAPFLRPTPLLQSEWLSSITGSSVYLKLESVHQTHSFKIRGALNALLKISQQTSTNAAHSRVVVTASAGNHGRAVASATSLLGLHAIVFTPRAAPETKKAAIRRQGAELRDGSADYDSAEQAALGYAESNGALYVSAYNDADVIAGAGTAGIEILESLSSPNVVIVPIGGGGLASGIGIAVKSLAPHVKVIGVEAEASTAFTVSLKHGTITRIEPQPSIADGLTGNLEQGSVTFDLVRRYIDDVVTVSETEIERAIRGLATEEHLIAEGAGAAATAAVLARLGGRIGEKAVVLLTGANIDLERFISVVATV